VLGFFLANLRKSAKRHADHLPKHRSEKQAAQTDEKLRKHSLGNYKSAALPAELCRR
jgi:hypothetical protein